MNCFICQKEKALKVCECSYAHKACLQEHKKKHGFVCPGCEVTYAKFWTISWRDTSPDEKFDLPQMISHVITLALGIYFLALLLTNYSYSRENGRIVNIKYSTIDSIQNYQFEIEYPLPDKTFIRWTEPQSMETFDWEFNSTIPVWYVSSNWTIFELSRPLSFLAFWIFCPIFSISLIICLCITKEAYEVQFLRY